MSEKTVDELKHEILNPLCVIQSLAQLILLGKVDSNESLRSIEKECRKIAAVLNNNSEDRSFNTDKRACDVLNYACCYDFSDGTSLDVYCEQEVFELANGEHELAADDPHVRLSWLGVDVTKLIKEIDEEMYKDIIKDAIREFEDKVDSWNASYRKEGIA